MHLGSLKQSQIIQSPQNVNNPFCTVDKDNTDSMEEALQQLAADMAKKASCKQITMKAVFIWHCCSDLHIKKSTWHSWKIVIV